MNVHAVNGAQLVKNHNREVSVFRFLWRSAARNSRGKLLDGILQAHVKHEAWGQFLVSHTKTHWPCGCGEERRRKAATVAPAAFGGCTARCEPAITRATELIRIWYARSSDEFLRRNSAASCTR